MAAPAFHRLRVIEVVPASDESVAVTFDVPAELEETFRFLPGQHVTIRAFIDGEDVRRSYSICVPPTSGKLRVGIKRLRGGAFSTWATTMLSAGDELDVMPPVGEFTVRPDPSVRRHYGAIAAGSGITPVLSHIGSILEAEPLSRVTLIFGNRGASTVMFLEELEGLKDRYRDRFHLVHVLSREGSQLELFSGRIDGPKLESLFATVVDADSVDDWYLCGPFEMVAMAAATLEARGVAADRIHDELFFAGPIDETTLPPEPPPDVGTVALTVVLEGRSSHVRMRPETPILDAALSVRRELPFSCRGGMCASCKARVLDGAVTMDKNYALVDDDLAAGYVLTCQAHPTTDAVVVDFDQR